jgi:hypothetical protein
VIDLTGKEFIQFGIVVDDAEETAKRYWEILGIGPWALIDFKPPHLSDAALYGIQQTGDVESHIKGALTNLGNVQLELLQPIKGPSPHMEYLKTHGQGINHLSFGPVDDYDEMLAALLDRGFEVEVTALLGGAAEFTYMATQRELGTIFEFGKVNPEVQSTLVPYGTYPSA